jgi:ubiquitin-large subunit ribosomal protein L40e
LYNSFRKNSINRDNILSIMQIFVKGLSNKTMALEVTPTMKVSELKSMVRDREGITDDVYIRLVFVSKELSNDDSTLADYNL